MSFDKEMDILIQRYLKDVYNADVDLEQIAHRPRWKRVVYYWKALEKYEGKKVNTQNLTLDEIKAIYGD